VIAAYNAGPLPISEWNARRIDDGDPLLYIESIPYWETRGYVPIVLRNYWVYEQKSGKDSASRKALAQGMWPKFPGASGPSAVRMTSRSTEFQPLRARTKRSCSVPRAGLIVMNDSPRCSRWPRRT
jgi:hypothetical protein